MNAKEYSKKYSGYPTYQKIAEDAFNAGVKCAKPANIKKFGRALKTIKTIKTMEKLKQFEDLIAAGVKLPYALYTIDNTDKAFSEWWMCMEVKYLNRKDGSKLNKGEWIIQHVLESIKV